MATQREAEILLSILLDTAKADEAVSGIKLLNATIDQLGANSSLQQQNDYLKDMSTMIEGVLDSWVSADDRLQQYITDIEQAVQDEKELVDYAKQMGDMPLPGADGGGDTGGGGGGSLFGVARGLRAGAGIGRIAGMGGATTQGFTAAADVLYLEQAFSKLGDVLPGVGAAVEGIGSQLIDAIPAFAGIGSTAAGMVAILGPMVALLAATAAGIAIFNKEIEASQKLLDQALQSTKSYYDAIQTGTTASIKAELDKLEVTKNAQSQDLALLQANYDKQHKALTDQENDLGVIALEHSALADTISKLKDTVGNTQGQIDGLNRAMDDWQVRLNDAADAIIKQTDANIAQQKQFESDDKLTMQAAQDKLTALEQDRKAQQDAAEQLSNFAYANALSGDALTKNQEAVAAHMKQAQDDSAEIDHLNNVSLGLIQTHKDEAQAVKDADEATKDYEATIKSIITAQNAYDKALQTINDNLANAISDSRLKEFTSEQQYQPGSTQDTFARGTIALKEQEAVTKIEEDTSNKIADIRTKLGETEAKDALDLNRQLFDDQIKYQDDRNKLVTDEQRQEQVDLIDHNNRLAALRQSAYDNEFDDVANRDFVKLARDERSASEKIQQEDTNYTTTEEKQRIHLANAETDLVNSLARQEAQQKTAEGRKIADAETSADNAIAQEKLTQQRKIEAAQDGMQQQLSDLERNNIEKITLLRESWYNEWSLLGLQANQREQIALDTQNKIVSGAEAILAQGTNNFIDDLNRLRAMAGGSSGGASVPSNSGGGASFSGPPDGAGSYGSAGNDVGGAVNNAINNIGNGISTFLQGLLAS